MPTKSKTVQPVAKTRSKSASSKPGPKAAKKVQPAQQQLQVDLTR